MFVITFSDIAKIIGGTAIVMIILFCLLIWWLSRKSEDDNENTCENIETESPSFRFKCSECGINLDNWEEWEYCEEFGEERVYEYEFSFCPNCGRKVK